MFCHHSFEPSQIPQEMDRFMYYSKGYSLKHNYITETLKILDYFKDTITTCICAYIS